ncbi:type II secretion system protein GspN [Myxococcota bacterium]|nr:type II secretion system protein GspN [Myxococcota bacterium]MBU1534673.1 type II secretion system protein GspN [Myxococcota bacterium]
MTGNSLKERLIRWVIYSVVGAVTFFVSLNLFMNWDLVKEKIVRELERMTGYDVSIADVSFGFSGIEMKEVVMVSRPEKDGEKPSRFVISSLAINASPLSLMKSDKDIGFSMNTLGGSISGRFSKDADKKKFKLQMDDIQIAKIPFLKNAISMPVKGKISMDGYVELDRHGWRKSNGEFNFGFHRMVVGDGKTKVKAKFLMPPKNKGQAKFQEDGFPLPPLSLGEKFAWTVTLKNGKAELKDFVTKSKDGEMELVGHIKFRDPIKLSMAEMYIKFKFSDEAKKKHDSLEVFELSLQRRGKRADGSFGMSISGQLAALRFLPRKTGIIDYKRNRSQPKGRNDRGMRSMNRDVNRRRGGKAHHSIMRVPMTARDRFKNMPAPVVQ